MTTPRNPLDLPPMEGDPPEPFIEVTWEPEAFTPRGDQPSKPEIALDPSKFEIFNDDDEDPDGDMVLYAVSIRCTECDDFEFRVDLADTLMDVVQAALNHQMRTHRA